MNTSDLTAAFAEARPMLMRLLVARLGSRDDAEDVLQDVWMRLDRLADRQVDQPTSFLFKVAANLAADRRIASSRRGVREGAWLELQPAAAEFPDAERQMISRIQLTAVEAAIQAMPERMRTALVLFRVEEQPHRVIAAQLGITVSGVEKLLRRAYHQLQAASVDPAAESTEVRRVRDKGEH